MPVKSVSPVELTSSAYFFYDATILSKAAKLLNRNDDYNKYSALAIKIKNAVNDKYLNKTTGIYGNGFQTELAVPLHMGIVPEKFKMSVAANLAKRIKADSIHLDVGILGAKAVLNALSDNGYADLAYKIAARETYPSWGWWIKNGATTLYENWNIQAANDISLNHIMFGEIGAWLYKGLGGIKPNELQPGFKNVLLYPNFVQGLDSFMAQHDSRFGNITSKWKRIKDAIQYSVSIPPNTTADIYFQQLEGKSVWLNGKFVAKIKRGSSLKPYRVQAGVYSFELK